MAFSLDDAITKLADAFEKSAENHYKQAEQAENLADLITDEDLRADFDDLVGQGAVFALGLVERLKAIFPQDEAEPTPEPEPEPTPEPQTAEDLAEDIFGADFRARLEDILSRNFGAIITDDEQKRGPQGGRFGNFPFA